MTDNELKELSEFAAEFLGLEKNEFGCWYHDLLGWTDSDTKYHFFECPSTAPILAHLAKREIEKRGYSMRSNQGPEAGMYWTWEFFPNAVDFKSGYGEHENEYIALFLAIREAVNGNKD